MTGWARLDVNAALKQLRPLDRRRATGSMVNDDAGTGRRRDLGPVQPFQAPRSTSASAPAAAHPIRSAAAAPLPQRARPGLHPRPDRCPNEARRRPRDAQPGRPPTRRARAGGHLSAAPSSWYVRHPGERLPRRRGIPAGSKKRCAASAADEQLASTRAQAHATPRCTRSTASTSARHPRSPRCCRSTVAAPRGGSPGDD